MESSPVPKYRSANFNCYMATAKNIEIIICRLSKFSIYEHLNMYENMIKEIETQIVKSINKKAYMDKCQKMTEQIGILTIAIQIIYKFKSKFMEKQLKDI